MRKGQQYRVGELEVILSLAPTEDNIARLATLLDRSEDAIRIVYRIAFAGFVPDADKGKPQWRKVRAAMASVGIKPL
jgi:hypothetical protein